ncbi:hypothetical protein N0V88_005224 [Collariella sp. IMI 366227]|nr:hypothetical protein N0V88_005224 [Collariella sp. IMI 366227]
MQDRNSTVLCASGGRPRTGLQNSLYDARLRDLNADFNKTMAFDRGRTQDIVRQSIHSEFQAANGYCQRTINRLVGIAVARNAAAIQAATNTTNDEAIKKLQSDMAGLVLAQKNTQLEEAIRKVTNQDRERKDRIDLLTAEHSQLRGLTVSFTQQIMMLAQINSEILANNRQAVVQNTVLMERLA